MTISYRVRKQIVDYFAQRKSSQEIASMLNVFSDASVNFHFDATRSFHLKIGKIK